MYLPDSVRKLVHAARRDRALVRGAKALNDAVALEPGGPSAAFGVFGPIPVYRHLRALDTLDYSERTLWSDGAYPDITPRSHLIAEAGALREVQDESYDALLASHVLEHIANPLGALAEWRRVVRPGGHLLLIMPHRDGTFDHRRPVTSLEHLREDAERETGEEDLTHLEEILQLHDLDRDPGAPDREAFEQRCRENLSSRAMHHHVFTSRSVVEMCRAMGLEVLLLRTTKPFNIICLCGVNGQAAGLSDLELSKTLRRSPFASDREDARSIGR